MSAVKRYLSGIAAVLTIMLLTLIASCQPVPVEPRPETNITATPEAIPTATPEPTPPPDTAVTPPPETAPADTPDPTPPPGTSVTPAPDTTPPFTPEAAPTTPGVNPLLTPVEKMGVTGVKQDVDISSYRLTVGGLVKNPLSLTYEEILDFSSVTEIVVLECPGFFRDTAEWTGVPLKALLDEAGLLSGSVYVVFSAVDGYRQKVTLEHVGEFDVFLAYKVNGQVLPPEHGYPLRVVDKGTIGSKWVKWLESITIE